MSTVTTAALSAEPNRDALELAADVARVGLWHWDLLSGLLTLDSRSAATHGVAGQLAAEEFIARVIHAADLTEFRALVRRAMSSPNQTSQLLRLVEQSGQTRRVELRMRASHDAVGKAVRLMTAVADMESDETRSALLARQAEA